MLILPTEYRNSAEQIFEKLDELYGDKVPASVLCSLYFNETGIKRDHMYIHLALTGALPTAS